MIYKLGEQIVARAVFLDGGAGATGLTVTVDVFENGAQIVSAASATALDATDAPGVYTYTLATSYVDAEGVYLFRFNTAGTVDQTDVYAQAYTPGWIGDLFISLTRKACELRGCSSEVNVERGTTWSISIETAVSATRGKLYFTVKESSLDDPLADVADSAAIVQIEETDGLRILNGVSQAIPNSDGAITVAGGLDSLTITLAAADSATVAIASGYFYDVRQVAADGTVTRLDKGRLNVTTETTRAVS